MKSIPPLPNTETPMRKRIRERINLRASLIQIPTPPVAGQQQSSAFPSTLACSLTDEFLNNDTVTSISSEAHDESVLLREISLLASARKSKLLNSQCTHSSDRIQLTEDIKIIFQEEKLILGSIDRVKLECSANEMQSVSRMKTEALRGFAKVMETVTRNELKQLRKSYQHFALFWIALARFEACHGHLEEAFSLLNEGVETVMQQENIDLQQMELQQIFDAMQQIKCNYSSEKYDSDKHQSMVTTTPRKRARVDKNSESKASIAPRRSPRFCKSN